MTPETPQAPVTALPAATASLPFPDRLRAAREAQRPKLSLPAAAARVGVSSRTMSYWEAGKHLPPATADDVLTQERVLSLVVGPNTTMSRGHSADGADTP